VDTIAASTILISYNWQKGTVRYERTAKFVDAFFSKISEFYKPPRNPLWKSVNLAATIPGWTRFPAAEEWLRNWLAIQAKGEEADFKQFMSEQATKPSTERTERLFQEFQIWKSKRNWGERSRTGWCPEWVISRSRGANNGCPLTAVARLSETLTGTGRRRPPVPILEPPLTDRPLFTALNHRLLWPQPAACPLWVKSRHSQCKVCPLYPRKRTFAAHSPMSALCQ